MELQNSLQNKPTDIKHKRTGLLLSFFLFICLSIYFYPCEYFSRTSYLGVSVILFFSFIFFLFDEDVFLNSVFSVDAKVPSFCMNMAITRFTVSKFIS